MTNNTQPSPQNMEEFVKNISHVSGQSQKLLQAFLNNQAKASPADSAIIKDATQTFANALSAIAANPQQFMDAQMRLYQNYLTLMANTTARMMGEDIAPAFETQHKDKRFHDKAWKESYIFDFIKQSYLLTSKWLGNTVGNVPDLDEKSAQKLDFYSKRFLDAMSPSNFLLTNPAVLEETLKTNGKNLVNGLQNLLEDLQEGGGFNVSITDKDAYKVGEDLATTDGKVIFQNKLMQLIEYSPTTKKTHQIPLLIVAPWINKYYILDLHKKNSFVKWLTDKGYSVFITSWKNPDKSMAEVSFDDYMRDGTLAALDAIELATGQKSTNIIGYCIGGTLAAATLAYLEKNKQSSRVKSATLLTTLIDFSIPGDLGVFISEGMIDDVEDALAKHGVFDGKTMSNMFSMLRANDLIWSFVVHNYLMGKEPLPFDLLYWNSDYTNMPAKMHSYYLRNMYAQNNLIKPNALKIAGTSIDISKIMTPTYFLSTKDDHIAPWQGTYKGAQLFAGLTRFVLSGSGHIGGVVNPPYKEKYGYWINDETDKSGLYPENAGKWEEKLTEHKGSWWGDWDKWMSLYNGDKIPALQIGAGKLKPLEDAPGSYVMEKAFHGEEKLVES